jgi:hypothetical protein
MRKRVLSFGTCLFVGVIFVPTGQRAAAQASPARIEARLPERLDTVPRSRQRHQPSCWEEAGIPKSAMKQRQVIQRVTRAEVDAVCADRSLSPEQRQQKIQQIHEHAKQEFGALLSPQQTEAVRSCQMSRGHGGGHGGGGAHGGRGPCGEITSRSEPNPSPPDKPEPEPED